MARPLQAEQYVFCRYALRCALALFFDGDMRRWHEFVVSGDRGVAPTLALCSLQRSPVHLSLSHSQSVVACAVSGAAIGIDVEVDAGRHRDFHALLDWVATDHEKQCWRWPVQSVQRTDFFQTWCAKEAGFKLHSRSQPALSLRDIETVGGVHGPAAGYFYRASMPLHNATLYTAVCCAQPAPPDIYWSHDLQAQALQRLPVMSPEFPPGLFDRLDSGGIGEIGISDTHGVVA